MDIEEIVANPADDAVNLDGTAAATPEAGEADFDALTKEALGETGAMPEFVEVEIDGKKYKVLDPEGGPVDPDLKFGALRDADYRKKTMEVAEQRKAFEQERAEWSKRANLEGDASLRARNLAAVDAQVRQLSQIDINALRAQGFSEEDIHEAAGNLRALTEQRDALARQVGNDVRQLEQYERGRFEQARQAAIHQAGIEDKALTPERCAELEQFAVESGIAKEDAQSITDPTAYKLLHLAKVGQQFIERQRKASAFKAAAAGSPASTLGGVQAGGKSPDQMGPAEMAKLLGY